MTEAADNQQHLPPWKRGQESVPDDTGESGSGQLLDDISSSEDELLELARANDRASRVQVVENFENLFFHDDFFRLVGIGAVGGFAISTLLIVVVLEFTDRQFAETFPRFWYVFPTLTILGFVTWTLLLLKVRVYRRDKRLREIAFGVTQQDSGADSDATSKELRKDPPGPRHSEPGEEWL
tara:strand:+ start:607 stop:1149 length:543 start_codon:yes stop_codon:yes gene_type:complete